MQDHLVVLKTENQFLQSENQNGFEEILSLKNRLEYFLDIEQRIGADQNLMGFVECNLGINRKLDKSLQKANSNFQRMLKKKEQLDLQLAEKERIICSLKKEVEDLRTVKKSSEPQRRSNLRGSTSGSIYNQMMTPVNRFTPSSDKLKRNQSLSKLDQRRNGRQFEQPSL